MKKHLAALAVVGWYLMVPPVHPTSSDLSTAKGYVDWGAPLSDWETLDSYDSAQECRAELAHQFDDAVKHVQKGDPLIPFSLPEYAKCIASDDPRLKGK